MARGIQSDQKKKIISVDEGRNYTAQQGLTIMTQEELW